MNRIFQIFKRLLEIHIATKTTDCNGFHKDTEKAYENAFDVFHKIKEIYQDTELDNPILVEDVVSEAYDLQEELKSILYDMIKENKDIAIDELLRGLALSTVGICGDLRKHITEKDED